MQLEQKYKVWKVTFGCDFGLLSRSIIAKHAYFMHSNIISVWICMTAAILLHLYALQCCCLVLHTRVSIPMFIAVSLFFLPFLFYCCTSSPYLRCVPINPLSDFFLQIKREVDAIYSHAIPFHFFSIFTFSITMLLTMPIFFSRPVPVQIDELLSH